MPKTKTPAKKNQTEVAVQQQSVFPIKENLEGVEARLPQIGIVHQAQMFKMPNGEKIGAFKARILDVSRANAYWKESFDQSGGGTPPDCWSTDGISPSETSSDRQSDTCAGCPMNQFGSEMKGGKAGAGKACKNMKRVHVLPADSPSILPFRLTVPPSNLKSIDGYVTNLSGSGIAYQLIETAFSLRETKSKGGIAYSMLVLDKIPGSDITDVGAQMEIRKFRDSWLSVMRGQEVNTAEVDS